MPRILFRILVTTLYQTIQTGYEKDNTVVIR